jgi:acetyl-CoA carboxylase biotin carboxyl carrier protein
MAGTVLEMKVAAGQTVRVGQEIAVVESMKMEVPVNSTADGVVATVHKAVGEFVNAGDTLIELK